MSTMAGIIAAHKYDHEGAVCSCSNEVQVGLRCDKQTHAEHVAVELAKAGYGNMADAWDQNERETTDLIKERDYLQTMCDRLAACIAPDDVLGEHSSMNDPWANALEYSASHQFRSANPYRGAGHE